MESFTLLCKVCSAVMLSNRISLQIAVLVEYALGKGKYKFHRNLVRHG